MNAEKNSVIGRIAVQCRIAHGSGMPLILIETNETELAIEAALASHTVDLLQPAEADRQGSMWQPYYRFLDAEPDQLERCQNFITDENELPNIIRQNGNLDIIEFKTEKPCLFVLHLTSVSWEGAQNEPSTIALLRAYVKAYVRCHDWSAPLRASCVILYGNVKLLPEDLLNYTEIIEESFPDALELMELVTHMAEEFGTPIELREVAKDTARALSGFGLMQARRMMQRLLWTTTSSGTPLLFTGERDKLILETKTQVLLQNGGLLELKEEKRSGSNGQKQDHLGGMDNFLRWIQENRVRASHADRFQFHRGVQRLKGILMCGVPGCGKTEARNNLQQEWRLPLIQMSVDRLMGSYLGDSERNMRQALKQAEAMAPCILWIDELDKGFSGSASSHDSASFKRMFGYFLTWMQTSTRPCFIYATANDIGQLPPEFFRSGRFDVLFSVFLPTEQECVDIFRYQMNQLNKRSQDEAKRWGASAAELFERDCFQADYMNQIMGIFLEPETLKINRNIKFVNGADIEKIVENAMMRIRSEPLMLPAPDKRAAPLEIDRMLCLDRPVTPTEWVEAVRSVIRDTTINTYGGSPSNLNSITACSIRLLRGNFVPAGRELLNRDALEVLRDTETGRITVKYESEESYVDQLSPYDRALHQAIASRIGQIASRMETAELEKLLR